MPSPFCFSKAYPRKKQVITILGVKVNYFNDILFIKFY